MSALRLCVFVPAVVVVMVPARCMTDFMTGVATGVPQSAEGARAGGARGGAAGAGDPHASDARPYGGRKRKRYSFLVPMGKRTSRSLEIYICRD